MHGSKGIMVDNLLIPRAEHEGEAWFHWRATVHQLIYMLSLIGSMTPLHRNNVKATVTKNNPVQTIYCH